MVALAVLHRSTKQAVVSHPLNSTCTRCYRQTVQPHIEWTNPQTGVHTRSPVWSRDSIRRHLLFSNNFSQLFGAVVRSMFVSLICRQNETLISRETGMVVEDHRKAFLDTVDGYRKWVTTMGGVKRLKKS